MIRLAGDALRQIPLSLRNVEDLLHERGVDVRHETVRLRWRRFGPMFASEFRKKRVEAMRQHAHWRWHLDEVYVKINGEMRYLWRAVDHEGEMLEFFVSKEWDKAAALKFIKKALKRHGRPRTIVTDGLRSYGAAHNHFNQERHLVSRKPTKGDAQPLSLSDGRSRASRRMGLGELRLAGDKLPLD